MKSKIEALKVVLFVLLVSVLLLSSCSPTPAAAPVETASITTAPVVEPTTPPVTAKPLKIAFIYGGPAQDYGYNWMWDLGRQAAQTYFGNKIETVVVENIPYSEEATRTIEQLIADGTSMIFDTATLADYGEKAAETHPEVAFLRADVVGYDNEAAFYYEKERYVYLWGYAAGLLTKSNKIGYVDAFPGPYANSCASALALGLRASNPNADVVVALIGSWYDPPAARQASEALIDSGVDVLIGQINMDTVMQVAEERGVWTFGAMHSMAEFAPNWNVTSAVVDTSKDLIKEFQAKLDGTWVGNKEYRYVKMETGFTLDPWGPNVPQEVKDKTQALFDRMVKESYYPFVGPINDNNGNLVIAQGKEIPPWDFFVGFDWLAPGVIMPKQ
jgi:basic membrane protein A